MVLRLSWLIYQTARSRASSGNRQEWRAVVCLRGSEAENNSMGQQTRAGTNIKVKVQPRAARNQVVGYRGDVLHLRVTAAPVGGQANQAVVSLLADALGIAKSRLRIVRGHSSRDKLVAVESLSPEEAQLRIPGSSD